MKKRKLTLSDLAPAGISAGNEIKWIVVAWGVSLLWSFRGPLAIIRETRYLRDCLLEKNHAVITVFPGLIGTALFGFYLTALVLAGLAIWHYVYHRRGARSDYLMRRLRDKWEYHRRCLAIPLLGITISLLLVLILWCSYRSFYLYMHRWAYSGTGGAY